eukprot:tig00001292_g8045.t1
MKLIGRVSVKVEGGKDLVNPSEGGERNYRAQISVGRGVRQTSDVLGTGYSFEMGKALEFEVYQEEKWTVQVALIGTDPLEPDREPTISYCAIDFNAIMEEGRQSDKWYQLWRVGTGPNDLQKAGMVHLVLSYRQQDPPIDYPDLPESPAPPPLILQNGGVQAEVFQVLEESPDNPRASLAPSPAPDAPAPAPPAPPLTSPGDGPGAPATPQSQRPPQSAPRGSAGGQSAAAALTTPQLAASAARLDSALAAAAAAPEPAPAPALEPLAASPAPRRSASATPQGPAAGSAPRTPQRAAPATPQAAPADTAPRTPQAAPAGSAPRTPQRAVAATPPPGSAERSARAASPPAAPEAPGDDPTNSPARPPAHAGPAIAPAPRTSAAAAAAAAAKAAAPPPPPFPLFPPHNPALGVSAAAPAPAPALDEGGLPARGPRAVDALRSLAERRAAKEAAGTGPAVAARYLEALAAPALREASRALVAARPARPALFLARHIASRVAAPTAPVLPFDPALAEERTGDDVLLRAPPAAYLRAAAAELVAGALKELARAQPPDPIPFLIRHLAAAVGRRSPVTAAVRRVYQAEEAAVRFRERCCQQGVYSKLARVAPNARPRRAPDDAARPARGRAAFIVCDPDGGDYADEMRKAAQARGFVPVALFMSRLEGMRMGAGSSEGIIARADHAGFAHVLHPRINEVADIQWALAELSALAEEHGLRYVGCCGVTSDIGAEMADVVACCLELPHNPLPLLAARRDKAEMKRACARAGLRVARFALLHSPARAGVARAVKKASGGGFPVVAKTSRGMGTASNYVVFSLEELQARVDQIFDELDFFSGRAAAAVVVEEFVPGEELAVNLFAPGDGSPPAPTDLWRYDKFLSPDHVMLYRRAALLDCTDPSLAPAIDYARRVAAAVGIERGPAHVELKLDPTGAGGAEPVLIEVGARLCGGNRPLQIRRVLPFDLFAASVDAFAAPAAPPRRPPASALPGRGVRPPEFLLHCFCPQPELEPGVLVEVAGLAEVRRLPSVREARVLVAPGERVGATENYWSYPASVLLQGPDPARLAAEAATAEALLQFLVRTDHAAAAALDRQRAARARHRSAAAAGARAPDPDADPLGALLRLLALAAVAFFASRPR